MADFENIIREPAVEGRFYAGSKSSVFRLIEEIELKSSYPVPEKVRGNVLGAVLPHAAHMYSGYQTVPFFKYLKNENIIPDTFIILNPNHSGIGPPISVDSSYKWKNCIGEILLDTEIAELLPYPNETSAQRKEHSAEVIVPFIQYYFYANNIRILPICLKDQTARSGKKLAEDLYSAIGKTGRNALLIASSDFSHFLSPGVGYSMDQLVLDHIERKDIFSLEETIKDNSISVCGYGPIMTLMAYSECISKNYNSLILARGHSGEVHPSRDVVDYISILFYSNN